MHGVGQVASNDPGAAAVLDTPLSAAWESIRTGLRRDCGARTFDGWLKPAELGSFDPDSGELELVMPSKFMADWVRSHFGERLTLAWRTALPLVREVRISAAAAHRRRPRCGPRGPTAAPSSRPGSGARRNASGPSRP